MAHNNEPPWDLERPAVCAGVVLGALLVCVATVAWILAIALAP